MRQYLVTEQEQDFSMWGVTATTKTELPPNARVLTREQVEDALFNAFINAQSSADVMQILNELFGSESE